MVVPGCCGVIAGLALAGPSKVQAGRGGVTGPHWQNRFLKIIGFTIQFGKTIAGIFNYEGDLEN